jgi:RimJ/RimL family protein N-acetyltransferase
MKKIGCTVEGILRSHLPKPDGGRRDSIILSITKEDWEQKNKALILSML